MGTRRGHPEKGVWLSTEGPHFFCFCCFLCCRFAQNLLNLCNFPLMLPYWPTLSHPWGALYRRQPHVCTVFLIWKKIWNSPVKCNLFFPMECMIQVGELRGPLQDGWGLTTDGQLLLATDSSATLFYIDPATMQVCMLMIAHALMRCLHSSGCSAPCAYGA